MLYEITAPPLEAHGLALLFGELIVSHQHLRAHYLASSRSKLKMSVASASENERKLDDVKNDCWHNRDSDLDIDSVLQRVSQLQAQLEVWKVLQDTEKLLLQAPSDKALPNQKATWVKHSSNSNLKGQTIGKKDKRYW